MLEEIKLRFFKGGSNQTLQDIRTLDYGVYLLLADQSRGIDTRFQNDAIVLIAANVKNEN